MTTPTLRRPPFPPSPDRINLRGYADMFRAARVEHRARQIEDALAVIARIDADASGLDRQVALSEQAMIFDVIAGKITVIDAALKLDATRRLAEASGAVPVLAGRTKLATAAIVIGTLHDAGDALLDEIDVELQHAVADLIDASAKIGNVRSDTDAGRASSTEQTAWRAMHTAHATIERCWRLADELRQSEFVPSVMPQPHYEDMRYRHPERLDQRNGNEALAVWLARQIDNGAEPAVVTAGEHVAIIEAIEEERAQTRHDRHGHIGRAVV